MLWVVNTKNFSIHSEIFSTVAYYHRYSKKRQLFGTSTRKPTTPKYFYHNCFVCNRLRNSCRSQGRQSVTCLHEHGGVTGGGCDTAGVNDADCLRKGLTRAEVSKPIADLPNFQFGLRWVNHHGQLVHHAVQVPVNHAVDCRPRYAQGACQERGKTVRTSNTLNWCLFPEAEGQ